MSRASGVSTASRSRSAWGSTPASGRASHRQRPAHGLHGGRSDHASGGPHGAACGARHRAADRGGLRLSEATSRSSRWGRSGEGLVAPVDVYSSPAPEPCARGCRRRRHEAHALRGPRRRGRAPAPGPGQAARATARWSPVVGEAGVGKSRLTYEFTHSHRVQDWLILEASSVSYGCAIGLLGRSVSEYGGYVTLRPPTAPPGLSRARRPLCWLRSRSSCGGAPESISSSGPSWARSRRPAPSAEEGFGSPSRVAQARLVALARDTLAVERIRKQGFSTRSGADASAGAPGGRRNHGKQLWTLLVFELWAERFGL